jgi:DNA-binding transcriptional regulator YhcF (GntR family)
VNITSAYIGNSPISAGVTRLSYKFQRLRERLRQAVVSGELTGRLPGERELAKRFKANPKTIGKALTDLAADGLLDRSIGRGTFVRGQTPQNQTAERWLVIADNSSVQQALADRIRALHSDLDVVAPNSELRPSFLDRFKVAINLAPAFDQDCVRNMLIRSFRILQIGNEPQGLMTHAILQDLAHGASLLLRELSLSNHRNILLAGPRSETLASILKTVAPDLTLIARENPLSIPDEVTAAIAVDQDTARRIHEQKPSLILRGMGILAGLPVCPGYYISLEEAANLAVKLLADANAWRPRVLWLSGARVDCLSPSNSVHGAPVSLSA